MRRKPIRGLSVYGKNYPELVLCWLPGWFGICPNAYYNYLKRRKVDYYVSKSKAVTKIEEIYRSRKEEKI